MYGIAGVVAAHEGHTLQLFNHEHAFVVHQGIGTGESGLTNGQLFLIEAGVSRVEVSIGVCHLWDFAGQFHITVVKGVFGVHGALVDLVHLAFFVIGGGFPTHPSAVAAIASVGGDDGAIRGGIFAYHDARAVGTDEALVFILSHRVEAQQQKA